MILKKGAKKSEIESFLGGILNPPDLETIVVRGKECEVVYANAKAEVRLGASLGSNQKCKTVYAKSIPDICVYCPYGESDAEPAVALFEAEDREGRMYSGTRSVLNWLDGKPVAMFFLRDISQEKQKTEQLFKLAYIDHLTGVPNRQKLKDDFAALEDSISENKLTGAVALFDLDNFKAINDTYGHNTGDVILRRIAEHLCGDKAFANRLYRLGGDEFVLFFTQPQNNTMTDDEMKKHYAELLSTTLQSYTLPNIELKCTLSMGVSFFPKHGQTLSEVLRKADIALYKAKDAGRNRVVFFEDVYDVAQKLKDLYINIQPILIASGKTYGYELIDHGSDEDANTINLSEFNRALDALGLKDIENDMFYFINYSKLLLTPTVLAGLPKDKFIVQLQFSADISQKDMQIYAVLKKAGYNLALVGLNSSKSAPELLKLVSYCKFSAGDKNILMQRKVISDNPKIRFIATGVDTLEAFSKAKETGFLMYQGYYFNQPPVVQKTKDIGPLKLNYFRLLKLSITNDYMDFREISLIISSDVALTYKLLRLLNSAAVGLKNVSSIAMAVAYLGEENLKKWIAVLALSGIAQDKPIELVRISLIRARFGELIAPHFRIKRDTNQVFMVGMLSLLHIALDTSREKLLDEVPVAEDISQSLLTKNGIHSDLLKFYENYEYANWDEVTRFANETQIDAQTINDAYIESVKWYNELVNT